MSLYAKQGATSRRTEQALLAATKDLIARGGIASLNMIDIADHSQVSRATLYNHYRDKTAVLYALAGSEVVRLFESSTGTPAEILSFISSQISSDSALAAMRIHDQAILAKALADTSDRIWEAVHAFLVELLGDASKAEGAARWLVGQTLQPITPEESKAQAQLFI